MTLIDRALRFAVSAHSGQVRKKSGLPFILHPLEAASIVGSMTNDEAVIAAAVLHDTVEDAGVTPEELRERFGDRVTDLVLSETEEKRADLPPAETWRIRKEESLRVLRASDDDGVRMLWLGDKLSNVRSFYRDYLTQGDSLWNAFHQNDPAAQAWYYRSIAECLSPLSDHLAYREYVHLVEAIFSSVKETPHELQK